MWRKFNRREEETWLLAAQRSIDHWGARGSNARLLSLYSIVRFPFFASTLRPLASAPGTGTTFGLGPGARTGVGTGQEQGQGQGQLK